MVKILFHLWTDKLKPVHDEQIFLEIKVYLAGDIEGFVLFCGISLFLLKSLIYLFGIKTLLQLFSMRLSSNSSG